MKFCQIIINILLIIFLIFSDVFSIEPIKETPFDFGKATSDFGPRLLNGVYSFHDGFDFQEREHIT